MNRKEVPFREPHSGKVWELSPVRYGEKTVVDGKFREKVHVTVPVQCQRNVEEKSQERKAER